MKSRRKIAILAIAIFHLTPLVLSAENQTLPLPTPPENDKPKSLEDAADVVVEKSNRHLPDTTIHHYVPIPMSSPPSPNNPPPKAIQTPPYHNYKPLMMPSYPPPATTMAMIAPPRYYNPYAPPPPSPQLVQLTPAEDRIYSQYKVVPPLIDIFPFNLWGPHGYYNLCPKTGPEDPVWSWGCAQAPYNVMGDLFQQQQQPQTTVAQLQAQPPPPQYQQPPRYQVPPMSQPYPYHGSPVAAASSNYNTYTLPSSPDPSINFLQQLANQYAQNPSTGYTSNGYYNYGGGTYAPVPNTGNFMSSAMYSSNPGRVYKHNNNGRHRGTLRNMSKGKKQKKGKAKPKVKEPVVVIQEEEEEEVEELEYIAEADEE